MKGLSTGRENQRADFVESLYKSLRKKTETALGEHNKLSTLASVYLSDGLDPSECIELLIIESNISRDAANAYVSMAQTQQSNQSNQLNQPINEDSGEYSFQFEDIHGKIFSSADIGITLKAFSDDEAWEKAEEYIATNTLIESDKIISVDRIS